MSIRQLAWGALCAGCLAATACGEARAEDDSSPSSGAFCGGIAAIQCPEGYTCMDDPDDDCDPAKGGADCGGICVKGEPQQPSCGAEDATRRYISKDPQQCAAIRFYCEKGEQPFFNDCGCGCEPAP